MSSSETYGIEQRKQRWLDFMDMNSSTRFTFMINLYTEEPERPHLWPEKKAERIEWILKKYELQMERMEWLRDDTVPYLDMLTGTEVFAEAFGCKVYRPEDNNPFALPLVHNAVEASRLKVPDLTSSSMAYLFDMADELKSRAGDEALFRLVDIQSPMDIASLIWDKNDIYTAMITEPEAVKELSDKVYQFLTAFLDEWFSRYGTQYVAHYPSYFMSGGMTLSEDEIGVVSPAMFEEFFLPELVALSQRYGGIGMHCCADAKHQWENFKKIPNLRLLNLGQPREVVMEAYKFFEDHVPQMHGGQHGSPETWPAQFPDKAHVALEVNARTKDEALALSDKLWEVCGRV